ncbi:hypothetical protein G195_005123 [Phytophthora kernoviae 00238/432]|uniref:Uncharacterized protein n=2 Tax=Phytophthora kernoviae TaxID=325452 RepID=A0A8T0LY76_9STRA|nr:hypothetical protein G195_005123 [Phytophthora kernoviae 00238/432]KAG2524365.1 hypothetical protein JM16_005020 [Phytophthora kernoviae]
MVCSNEEIETPTGDKWQTAILNKPKTNAAPCHKSTLTCDDDEEEKPSEHSTGNSSLILDSSASPLHFDADNNVDQFLHDMANNMIGRNIPFESPFGVKAQVYADYTASGKSLECIERFIHDQVMPTYGNTHTTTSVTGLQTTSFREEARHIIAEAVNAHESKDVVIFAGQGCTSAINKLVTALGIHKGRRRHRANKRPVVFTCPFSHHSNLLPWRESPCADEVQIPEAEGGGLDLEELERQLQIHQNRPLKIGSFAAASNLTGMLIDVDKVSKLLHKYGALSCWDYATCAPYVDINMNPKDKMAYKDAVFFSGHKFVGGPGSPGVLVVKKNLMNNEVPTMPGGGTVLFVTEKAHSYLSNKVEREEGGTPDILGSIRLGLAFQMKQRLGPRRIMDLERQHVHHVRESLSRNENIVVLGRQTDDVDQLPIFSFMIRFNDRFLHHNFVCALLNDMFGIQARGGCQCAGPFGSRLLGLSREHIVDLGHAVVAKHEVLKPGVARMSFPYFADEEEANYILEAVHFVADHGWKFLPEYDFNCRTGVWRHISRADVPFPAKKCLSEMQVDDVEIVRSSTIAEPIRDLATHRRRNLEQAIKLADRCIEMAVASNYEQGEKVADSYEGLRWFVYPSEAVAALQELGTKPPLSEEICGPCQPYRYFDPAINHVWDGIPTMATMKRHWMKMAARMFISRYCLPNQDMAFLMSMKPDPSQSEQFVERLDAAVQRIDRVISEHIGEHHATLLNRVGSVDELQNHVTSVQSSMGQLKQSVHSLEAQVREQHENLRDTIQRYCNVEQCGEIVRRVLRFQQLSDRVLGSELNHVDTSATGGVVESGGISGDARQSEMASVALAIREMEMLVQDESFEELSVVRAKLPATRKLSTNLKREVRATLRTGIQNLSQADVGDALQILFYLGDLATTAQASVNDVIQDVERKCTAAISEKKLVRSGGNNSNGIDPSNGPSSTSSGSIVQKADVWKALQDVFDVTRVHALQVWNLQRVLLKMVDPASGKKYLDLVLEPDEPSLFATFWEVTCAIVRELFASTLGYSTAVKNVLIAEYPRMRDQATRVLNELHAATNQSTGTGFLEDASNATTETSATTHKRRVERELVPIAGSVAERTQLLDSMAPLYDAFIDRAYRRMSNPIQLMFPQSSNFHASPPGRSDMQTLARTIFSELEQAGQDPVLLDGALQQVRKAVNLFCSNVKRIMHQGKVAAATMPSYGRTPAQAHNVGLMNVLSLLDDAVQEVGSRVEATAASNNA